MMVIGAGRLPRVESELPCRAMALGEIDDHGEGGEGCGYTEVGVAVVFTSDNAIRCFPLLLVLGSLVLVCASRQQSTHPTTSFPLPFDPVDSATDTLRDLSPFSTTLPGIGEIVDGPASISDIVEW